VWVRLAETIHGHLGVLAAVALVHPAVLLRRGAAPSRGARWAIALSTALVTLAFSAGIAIYPHYRSAVRRPLFALRPAAGWLFETKEHLAFAVLSLALGAAVCALAAPRDAAALRRAAAAQFAAAAGLCALVAALGSFVASVRGF
jgi:hypothetical protein